MEIEEKQAEVIDHFVKQVSAQKGSALGSVFVEATSHPSLFAFSEILAVPTVAELEGTDNSVHLEMLRLFAHGTWSDYKRNSCKFPQLVPDQVLKLKQLTVLTLAETKKVLSYDQLMLELDVTNVRELEDFLINDCMYAGLVRGKLDQLRRYFEVQFAAGRDLRPGQLGSMIQTLSNWLATSDNLLVTIQDKIKWADTMSELDKKHRKELEDRVMEVKKAVSVKYDSAILGSIEKLKPPRGRKPSGICFGLASYDIGLLIFLWLPLCFYNARDSWYFSFLSSFHFHFVVFGNSYLCFTDSMVVENTIEKTFHGFVNLLVAWLHGVVLVLVFGFYFNKNFLNLIVNHMNCFAFTFVLVPIRKKVRLIFSLDSDGKCTIAISYHLLLC
ncbi:COP9 signalosome complex subunit 7-like isoform X1 [Gossypium arboreum]|uniref:COP9 signalosome complex subunit 7-like isoform X1 n=2 Tax=Gossypium arboreum TaxID=29729 RepID=UPI0008191BA9|nr:COP9 signalosome complex subunit 7-like isoform X1 [Gossypium arboreum]